MQQVIDSMISLHEMFVRNHTTWFVLFNVAIPPRIRSHPQEPKDVVFGEPVTFTIQASGTKPLSYQWQWKPATKDGESEAWQPCDVEGHDNTSATLSIPSVLKSNEGRYRCIVNNIAGTKISEPVKLKGQYIYCLCPEITCNCNLLSFASMSVRSAFILHVAI